VTRHPDAEAQIEAMSKAALTPMNEKVPFYDRRRGQLVGAPRQVEIALGLVKHAAPSLQSATINAYDEKWRQAAYGLVKAHRQAQQAAELIAEAQELLAGEIQQAFAEGRCTGQYAAEAMKALGLPPLDGES
jgi:hypothetical protein